MKKLAFSGGLLKGENVAHKGWVYDPWIIVSVFILLILGLIMVGSTSVSIGDRKMDNPFFFFFRQGIYVAIGIFFAYVVIHIKIDFWKKYGSTMLLFSVALLCAVLVPGVGVEVNGSMRWISLGVANIQPSEFAKLFAIVYLAGYLVRREHEIRTAFVGFLKPMVLLAFISVLLLAEPDFGSVAVMLLTAMGMMFLGGVRLWQFGLLLSLLGSVLVALIYVSPYRLERLTGFVNPWADPFGSGFQLTQALIAFGRGEWFGVGLGSSVQKLFYLPEAHTDFLFAVMAEELGVVASVLVIALFCLIVFRSFYIGRECEREEKKFSAYIAYGIGIWIGIQALTNIGVSMGVLPTKGLTLPLMSYGGSSIVVMCVAMAMLIRVDYENSSFYKRGRGIKRKW